VNPRHFPAARTRMALPLGPQASDRPPFDEGTLFSLGEWSSRRRDLSSLQRRGGDSDHWRIQKATNACRRGSPRPSFLRRDRWAALWGCRQRHLGPGAQDRPDEDGREFRRGFHSYLHTRVEGDLAMPGYLVTRAAGKPGRNRWARETECGADRVILFSGRTGKPLHFPVCARCCVMPKATIHCLVIVNRRKRHQRDRPTSKQFVTKIIEHSRSVRSHQQRLAVGVLPQRFNSRKCSR